MKTHSINRNACPRLRAVPKHPTAIITLLLTLLSAHALVSCVKDDLYNTPHPDKGAIVITTDWSRRSEGLPAPGTYTVEVAGIPATLHQPTAPLPGVFAPGSTELLAYNTPAGVTIASGTATIQADAVPEVLFSGHATVDVRADDTLRTTLAMRQLFRHVQFALTITGGDAGRIKAIQAQLTGIAPSILLRTGEVTGTATAVSIPFRREDRQLDADLWLPGTADGATQHTVVTLTFADGNRQTVNTDVTQAFTNFNADKLTTLRLSGSLYAPVGSEVEGSIIEWTDIEGGDIDANM